MLGAKGVKAQLIQMEDGCRGGAVAASRQFKPIDVGNARG